ncbi:hypothetical protein BG005_011235 [Podila minutissima]|nr:hypothetical protein BG005_011235 [Podila minutissima]
MVRQVDILGQQPGLNIYTQLTLCYPVTDASLYPTVINTLNDGLEQLAAKVPWAAGEVVVEGASEGNSGMATINPMEELPRVVVNDLRNDASAPSMQTLSDADFPMSMLDENMLCPRNTLLGTPGEPSSRPAFLVQATFVSGGLLLSFVGQHQVMDMIGQGTLMDLLNKACHHQEFTAKELDIVNVARENIIPLLDDSEKTGLEHQGITPPISNDTSAPVATPPSPPPTTWASFSFNPISLASLKSIATETVPSGFISTDDALSALIWQSIIRARLARLSPTDNATFARAVDLRGILGVEAKYPGVVQNLTYNTLTLQQIVDEPLGVIASRLRSALDKDALGRHTRAFATRLHQTQDKKTAVSDVAHLNLSADLMLSSWSKVDCWGLDFNMGLGKPEAVRRPKFSPFASLMYLMPKAPNGEVLAAICLTDEDMDRLKADKEFIKFGRFIG